ncbi:MAG: phenylacetic acid degradation bifunctional protein PaaZ [Pseudomonadota bacterium]
MTVRPLQSHIAGHWVDGAGARRPLVSAIDGSAVAEVAGAAPNLADAVDYARSRGGPALAALSFHQRAGLVKQLALAIAAEKESLYALSSHTGATRADSWIDIEGGTGTMLVLASKTKRELPDERLILDGDVEQLSREGTFLGQHIYTSRPGVCVQINAYNFPIWGMLEKLAPALLAGLPVIAKAATVGSYLAEACARIIVQSGILPDGAFQFVAGPVGELLDPLGVHDTIAFTGSAATAATLRRHAAVIERGAMLNAEQDSLNCTVLGPDAAPGTPEFDLLVREVQREMTTKAGQKCTAIRRVLVPEGHLAAVVEAVSARLAKTRIGDPREETTRMGALAGAAQRDDVRARVGTLLGEAELAYGSLDGVDADVDAERGAFLSPLLLVSSDGDAGQRVHDTEAFGPVATVIGYRDVDHAVALANRGGGSLVGSLFTHDPAVAAQVALGAAPWHGRFMVMDRDAAGESTGHGSPLAHLTHGGPGRAGGGEELGGVRAIKHLMQRSALQGSPRMLSAIGRRWLPGAPERSPERHPFQVPFGELQLGDTFHSDTRTVSTEDVEHFAHFTGDTFYAHMDERAVEDHPFFPGRVAHGYLLLSFAAGLFVSPEKGPTLANYGLDNLRFLKPVTLGERIAVRLTVKAKKPRNADYGEVRWDVEIVVGEARESAAQYELLTMNAHA